MGFRGFDVWVGYDAAKSGEAEIGDWLFRKLCKVIVTLFISSPRLLDLSFCSVRRSWSFGRAASAIATSVTRDRRYQSYIARGDPGWFRRILEEEAAGL
ncbi:hypothetical protein Bca4012_030291 [Brassica carinata]|uniref:Uncharacterized protein n=1 Tax=Brassica carinata TaxID=52824 RepID=A0A8X7RGK7_BRACI|nr:hypothetical protein Bca52824_048403 [Brassica carinata]